MDFVVEVGVTEAILCLGLVVFDLEPPFPLLPAFCCCFDVVRARVITSSLCICGSYAVGKEKSPVDIIAMALASYWTGVLRVTSPERASLSLEQIE